MKPQTEAQSITFEAIRKIQSMTGRTVLLREIADVTGRSVAAEWGFVKVMTRMGILTRGRDGTGRGVRIVVENRRYQEGWKDAAQHMEDLLTPILLQHHSSQALIEAVLHAILDAKAAAEGRIDAPEEAAKEA